MTINYVGPTNLETHFIMELSSPSVKLLAKGLHLLMSMSDKESKLVDKTFEALMGQSNVVSKNPVLHGIYKDKLEAPPHATRGKDVYISFEDSL